MSVNYTVLLEVFVCHYVLLYLLMLKVKGLSRMWILDWLIRGGEGKYNHIKSHVFGSVIV